MSLPSSYIRSTVFTSCLLCGHAGLSHKNQAGKCLNEGCRCPFHSHFLIGCEPSEGDIENALNAFSDYEQIEKKVFRMLLRCSPERLAFLWRGLENETVRFALIIFAQSLVVD